MFKMSSKHFLTGEELLPDELNGLLETAIELKRERDAGVVRTDLKGKSLILFFEKPSLRTHVSFSIGMQELGGFVTETYSSIRKKEEPEDVARVLAGYAHAVMIRTFEHSLVERIASSSKIPVINGLTDTHHPCQVLADLMVLKQKFGTLKGLKLAYIGDGNNMLHSLLLLAPVLGIEISYACPKGYEPSSLLVKKAKIRATDMGGTVTACPTPEKAVAGAHAIYTDVWASMGFESEEADREKAFQGFQLNSGLYDFAAKGAILMHCMPMIRGKEITSEMADHENSALWMQSENRLHVQKALLLGLLGNRK